MLLPFNVKEDIEIPFNFKIYGAIHVGANRGEELDTYQENDINNLLFFEPQPHVFEDLIKKVPVNTAYQYAIGDTICEVEMNVEDVNLGHSSSILNPKIHLERYPHIEFIRRFTTHQITLDSFFEEKNMNIDDYNLLVIDTQGYELNVLKGSVNILSKIKCIICEINFVEMYENCALVNDIDNFLSNFGFKRVKTRSDLDQWGDGLYIKE